MTTISSDLQDLVDNPRETLEIELKNWLSLDDDSTRSKLAKHIAALANHGGGYIVFGFNDDLTVDANVPKNLGSYSHDSFTGIIKRYLSPPFQVDVMLIKSAAGTDHAILRVPSHGVAPICAIASGPDFKGGQSIGLKQGTYYIRSPGPESVPITKFEQWQPLINRCVVNERQKLLNSISAMLQGTEKVPETPGFTLRDWHSSSEERHLSLVLNSRTAQWPVPLNVHHYQLSYRIHQTDASEIPPKEFLTALEQANNEVRNTVWTGWSMFYPFDREEIKPYIMPDRFGTQDVDVYETNLLNFDGVGLPDFWRITRTGWATLIRPYREDRQSIPQGRDPALEPGTWISPKILTQELTEIVSHAIAMLRFFPRAESVEFICSWRGLANRKIADFDRGVHWNLRVAKADGRKTTAAISSSELDSSRPKVVADLANPVFVLFDGLQITQEWVRSIAPSFRKL